MQVEYQEHGLLVPWTDPTSGPYGNIPLDESAPDLLASESPTDSPSQQHHHLLQQQQRHNVRLNQQRQRFQGQKLVASPSVDYLTHSSAPYLVLSEAEQLGHFEYANNVVPDLISHTSSDMRTGPGGGGRVEGAGVGKRGWKRKREDKDEEFRQQSKIDGSQRCDVCGEQASGHYFGALVCLPCKSFFIRCTKDGRPNFSSQCGGKCDVLKGGRVRCQHCRFQKCISAGMFRKEKPEAVEPAEGQLLCKVCGDIANGVHFGVTTCEGCKKFFRRGLKENRTYTCKSSMHCSINPRMRNNCRYCRYQKCLYEGMSREAIKMGRPKKGELSYRKPLKNNGMRHHVKGLYEKQSESARSSMSSEYDQDDVSTSDDVFDPMSAQHQQLHQDHQQLSSQMQQSQQQQQQQQQPQQSGAFSLGSILHDCMTVQDWDQKVEMDNLEHGVQNLPSQSVGSGDMIDDIKPSPHLMHSSSTLLSEMLSRQMHQQQEQQQHMNMLQHVKIIDPVQQRHHVVAYQVHNSNSVPTMEAITEMEFSNEHNLPVNRAIKVENVTIHDGPDSEYTEAVVLEDMRNLETISKSDFQAYQIQVHDPNSAYSVNCQRAAVSPSSDNPTLVSISHLDPSVSSQIVAINMSSQSVLYTPHNHQDTIIIQNVNQAQQTIEMSQNQDLDQNSMEHRPAQNEPNLDHDQQIKMNDVFPSGRSHQIITNQGVIRTSHHLHSVTSNPQVQIVSEVPHDVFSHANSNLHQQQFSPEITNVSSVGGHNSLTTESLSPRRLHGTVDETNFTVLSSNSHHTITSLPASFTSSSQNAIQTPHKISGIKSPIAAILQQHKDAIQAGRPIQLSPEEIEELLNTVNAEQQLRFLNEQTVSKDHRIVSDQNNVDTRRQSVGGFMVCSEQQQQQLDELGHYNRQTPPDSAGSYHSISTSNQYQSNSPISQNTSQVHRKRYENLTSPGSNSSSSDRQELSRGYSNNNNNQVSHYISQQHAAHTSPNNQTGQHNEVYDDSFNSSLIRDSTLLHEINRIFLGIDNSCDAYGCSHQDSDERDDRTGDRVVVSMMSPDEFTPEVSHKYWHGFHPPERFVTMTADRHKIIQDVLDAFDSLQKTYMTNEPEYVNRKMSQDQLEHWHHIQRRIARHVVAGQRFCRNIPGYFKLDIQDRISLGKHVGFGLMVLIACTEFYDPESKRFKHIWNWTMPMQNPLFSYKIHLLSLGDKIHDIQMDRTETSMICAISMTSIDCPGLLKPEIVCVVRDALIDALQAHIATKANSSQRLKQLLSFMPQVRLMTVWYNNLMKKMSLPSDVINSKIAKARLTEAVGAENTPNFG